MLRVSLRFLEQRRLCSRRSRPARPQAEARIRQRRQWVERREGVEGLMRVKCCVAVGADCNCDLSREAASMASAAADATVEGSAIGTRRRDGAQRDTAQQERQQQENGGKETRIPHGE